MAKVLSLLSEGRRAITRQLRRSKLGTCAVFVIDNQLAKLRLVRGDIEVDGGARHKDLEVDDSVAYIERVHREYLEVAKLDRFYGRVAEVGPGDNCGVALLMLADGAEHVDLVDRFYSVRNVEQQARIYRALIAKTPALYRFRGFDREEHFAGITRHYGEKASAENFFLESQCYDFIVSGAVMEHVTHPILSLHRMREVLKPGGLMIHEIDLRDHGMFSDYGFHELKFLEVPSWLYSEMTKASGRPNRVPLSAYRAALPDAEIKVKQLVGSIQLPEPMEYEEIPLELRQRSIETVRAQKARLRPEYRVERDEDLSVSVFSLIVRGKNRPAVGM